MNVINLPTRDSVDELWQRYHGLVAACLADPTLWADRHHQETIIRAHKRYADAFLLETDHAQAG